MIEISNERIVDALVAESAAECFYARRPGDEGERPPLVSASRLPLLSRRIGYACARLADRLSPWADSAVYDGSALRISLESGYAVREAAIASAVEEYLAADLWSQVAAGEFPETAHRAALRRDAAIDRLLASLV